MTSIEGDVFQPTCSADDGASHATLDECGSAQGERTPASRKCDAGMERLIEKTPTTCPSDIVHCRASKPPTYLGFSVLVALCCNCPIGAMALLFSCLSRRSFSQGRHDKAKGQGNIAKWLNIVAVAVTTVVVAFLIVFFVFINGNIVDTVSELRDTINSLSNPQNATANTP